MVTCIHLQNQLYFLRFSTDKDMNIEGFSLETCRSMIAFMDVSFGKISAHVVCAQEVSYLVVEPQNTYTKHILLKGIVIYLVNYTS